MKRYSKCRYCGGPIVFDPGNYNTGEMARWMHTPSHPAVPEVERVEQMTAAPGEHRHTYRTRNGEEEVQVFCPCGKDDE